MVVSVFPCNSVCQCWVVRQWDVAPVRLGTELKETPDYLSYHAQPPSHPAASWASESQWLSYYHQAGWSAVTSLRAPSLLSQHSKVGWLLCSLSPGQPCADYTTHSTRPPGSSHYTPPDKDEGWRPGWCNPRSWMELCTELIILFPACFLANIEDRLDWGNLLPSSTISLLLSRSKYWCEENFRKSVLWLGCVSHSNYFLLWHSFPPWGHVRGDRAGGQPGPPPASLLHSCCPW